jgi:hypothetical protein
MNELLGFENKIHYGTFNKLCERIINKDIDIRKAVESRFANSLYLTESSSSSLPQALLIDELDVFFDPEFYGNTYQPMGKI